MFIEPNSTIKILKDVPLDITYEHTIYFDNISDQYNYFNSKVKPTTISDLTNYTLTKQTYTRPSSNQIRIEIVSDKLYDCNYIMFQNTNFGNKWFYAFIKNIIYINNQVSVVEFELDVMQTWFFDYELKMSFVEREHTESDMIGGNIIEENLDVGELVCIEHQYTSNLNSKIVAVYAENAPSAIQGSMTNNIFSPATVSKENANSVGAASMSVILGNLNDSQQVLALYQAPDPSQDLDVLDPDGSINDISFIAKGVTGLDGYIPKNNKLYCYPYNFVVISNNAGGTSLFKFELSEYNSGTPIDPNPALNFRIKSVDYPSPMCMIIPRRYRRLTYDFDSALSLNVFPVCGWLTDTFKAWWAQNSNTFNFQQNSALISATVGTVGGIIGTLSGSESAGVGAIAGAVKTFMTIEGLMAKKKDIQAAPPQVSGHFKTEGFNASYERIRFDGYHMSIRNQYARIIDDYFSKFGYACKKVKYPNRHARRYWTYTKTVGCVIEGSMPCDDEAKICTIYDNGITFWKYTNGETLNVGDYSLNNSVII